MSYKNTFTYQEEPEFDMDENKQGTVPGTGVKLNPEIKSKSVQIQLDLVEEPEVNNEELVLIDEEPDLYANHDIKKNIVIGPVQLQKPVLYTTQKSRKPCLSEKESGPKRCVLEEVQLVQAPTAARGRGRRRAAVASTSREWVHCGKIASGAEVMPVGGPLEVPLRAKRQRMELRPRLRPPTTHSPVPASVLALVPATVPAAVLAPEPPPVLAPVPAAVASPVLAPEPPPVLAPVPAAEPAPGPSGPLCQRPTVIANLINYGSEDEEDLENETRERTSAEFPLVPEELEQPADLPAGAEAEAEALAEAEAPAGEVPLHPVQGMLHEPKSVFEFQWSEFPNPPLPAADRRERFSTKNCGPTAPMPTPYDAFVAIWDNDIMEYIAAETNRYAQDCTALRMQQGELAPQSRVTSWVDTNVDELYVYFAIIIATGVVVKSDVKEYWGKEGMTLPLATPEFGKFMSLDRFQLLSRFLHFTDNSVDISRMSRPAAKVHKVAPIVDHLNRKFQELYRLDQNIALDESLTQWKGCLNIKQFINNKAASVGIKTYEVCESSTGYLWRFEVHAGRDSDAPPPEESPISGHIPSLVLRLLKGLENKGHTVWMDNYYNSPALARQLKALGFDCVGTLRTNRQLVPPELSSLDTKQMVVGQISGATSGDVDILVWRDQNRVAMISTYHGNSVHTRAGKTKPTVVHDYNVCMGGVDKKDQMLATYPLERKRTKVWYKKLFKRLLNVSVLNALILHRRDSHPTDTTKVLVHREFRKHLLKTLLDRHSQRQRPMPIHQSPVRGPRALLQHLPAQYETHPGTNIRQRRRCAECHKRTTFFCSGCKVTLCVVSCYGPYHSRMYL